MEMSVSSEMTFFTTKQQSEICPHLRTGSSAEDRGRIDTRAIVCTTVMILSHTMEINWLHDKIQLVHLIGMDWAQNQSKIEIKLITLV